MTAIPKGWRFIKVGAQEKLKDRYRFINEGGSLKLGEWTPINDTNMIAKVMASYIVIRKIKKRARRKSK